MRYVVTARVKPGREAALARAIEDGALGAGSIAGDEYLRNMECARRLRDGTVKWVEICFCATPLAEERPYWEEYFELVKVQDAHARTRCRDLNGEEPWACLECDCTDRLEAKMVTWGTLFLERLDFARKRQDSPLNPRAEPQPGRSMVADVPGEIADAERGPLGIGSSGPSRHDHLTGQVAYVEMRLWSRRQRRRASHPK